MTATALNINGGLPGLESPAQYQQGMSPDDRAEYLSWLREQPRHVRIQAPWHGSCPAGILSALAQDPVADVRAVVARNALTPADAIERLAQDPDETVRAVVARRAECGAEWQKIAEDAPMWAARERWTKVPQPHGHVVVFVEDGSPEVAIVPVDSVEYGFPAAEGAVSGTVWRVPEDDLVDFGMCVVVDGPLDDLPEGYAYGFRPAWEDRRC